MVNKILPKNYLRLNIHFILPDDFKGNDIDALEEFVKYKKSKSKDFYNKSTKKAPEIPEGSENELNKFFVEDCINEGRKYCGRARVYTEEDGKYYT